MQKAQRILNPIIDWTDEDVWEFLKGNNVPYCKLYDEGYKRLGCIGCPMGTVKKRKAEFDRYPKYKQAYIRAFDRMIAKQKSKEGFVSNGEEMPDRWLTGGYSTTPGYGKKSKTLRWESGGEVMSWWIK